MKSIKKILFSGLSGLITSAPLAMAQNPPDFGNLPTPIGAPTQTTELIAKITSIIKWIQYGLFIAATVLIVLAAYDYLFSKGDPEKVKTAQNTLIYAVIALVVGIIAGGLPKIVQGILGVA